MNTLSNALPDSPIDPQVGVPTTLAATRPLYWSVRRELWEHRSLYVAPLVAAAVVLLGFMISGTRLPHEVGALSAFDPSQQRHALARPYGIAAMLIMATGVMVGVFYSIDALHGERRDRSVLFWKSLPVSDLTTVLSKASIPFVVLPLLVFAITAATQLALLLWSTAVLSLNGLGVSTLWSGSPVLQMDLVLLYGLTVLTLWHAPIYAWLLLVSGLAKRMALLWAVLLPTALCVIEMLAFQTSYLGSLLKSRLFGFTTHAFTFKPQGTGPFDSMMQLEPARFFSSPGLWVGLAISAIFLAAAVRMRRYSGPL